MNDIKKFVTGIRFCATYTSPDQIRSKFSQKMFWKSFDQRPYVANENILDSASFTCSIYDRHFGILRKSVEGSFQK